MNDKSDTIQDQMAKLRATYAGQLPGKLNDLLEQVEIISTGTDPHVRSETLSVICNIVHKLAGSGATFGFAEVSKVARRIEDFCISLEGNGSDNSNVAETLTDLMGELKKAAAIEPVERTRLSDIEPKADDPVSDTAGERVTRTVMLLEYDDQIRNQMASELGHFGFKVIAVAHPKLLASELEKADIADGVHALITGLTFDGDDQVGIETIAQLCEAEKLTCPIIIHTRIEDIEHRLSAVRAGARHYLVKPVDMADMVDVLDRVTSEHEEEPFRILIIDDDESLARHSELVLKSAGMTTCVLTDPLGVMDVLSDFIPELILLDLYMPDCEGNELAAIIRQQEEFNAVPIVFLSGEQDVQKQLSALGLGGDDFLTKPISSNHLVSAVQIRAQRFRELRLMMVKDSMTGLYNHTATKQLLSNEITRAERSGATVSLAALDIDHFKSVNDSYGHAVGDRVIKSLARLLRQRLRGADIIGRMGGEEFAAVLPGAGIDEAETIFNQIRQAFADIVFRTEGKTFSVTISCGIAEYPEIGKVSALSDAADKALYVAKTGGRNKVIVAGKD